MHVIGITGRNRVGKTTLARLIRDEAEKNKKISVKIVPFAEILKKRIVEAGFPREFLDKKSYEARRLMQAYGDAARALNPRVFIDVWVQDVERLRSEGTTLVIADDMYHVLELNTLLDFAGDADGNWDVYLINVENPRVPFPSEKALEYASVREQIEISVKIMEMKEEGLPNVKFPGLRAIFNVTNDIFDPKSFGILPRYANMIVESIFGS